MPRAVIDPAVPDRESLDNEIAQLRGLDVGGLRARWHTAFGRRAPLTCPATCYFAFSPIGSKPIGSATSMPKFGVCLAGSGQGHRKQLTGLRLTSTEPEPS
jgi:hypothetical protein